ncbi:AsmA family protein [Mongoliitalea daihaiensis]|uniref:AsmA family protein n=1 Tax=Mongoliitalea daihaiensis TaxID=2782006 RepID=UPI001F349DC0|nr:AsmA-like C-terminal region-containing protein [Mongoliitalea daihaiensis]UJP66600.1 AsmA family protein [Mongoliitalea daihaiensis]
MKKPVKIFLILLSIPVVVLAIGIAVISWKQEALTQQAIQQINQSLNGELVLAQSRISPFSNFPYISIDLQGLKFYGEKDSKEKPMYEVQDLYVGFSVLDILTGNYQVKSIKLKGGFLHLVKNEHGEINLLTAKNISSSDASDEEGLDFSLQSIKLDSFDLSFLDEQNGLMYTTHIKDIQTNVRSVDGLLDLNLVGELSFDLENKGTPTFFVDKAVRLNLDLAYDSERGYLDLSPSSVWLEESLFSASGYVSEILESPQLDLKIEGQKPDFNLFAAFLPKEVAAALNDYQNQGEIFFIGTIRGGITEGEAPAIAIEFGCDNAYFLRADNQRRVEDLRFVGFYTNGSERSLKTSEFRLQNFNAKPDKGFFQADLLIRDFLDPYIKVKINADLDLKFVGDFFELEDFEGLSGQVSLTMDFDELVDLEGSATDFSQMQKSLQSELRLQDLKFAIKGYPYPVENVQAHAIMSDGRVQLNQLKFNIKDSDFSFKGALSDFPALLHQQNKGIEVSLEAQSKAILLGQLLEQEESENLRDVQLKFSFLAQANDLLNFDYLPNGIFKIEDFYAKLDNFPHTFHDFDAEVEIAKDVLLVSKFKGEIDQTDFLLSGQVDNYSKWMKDSLDGQSVIQLNLSSKRLNLNDLLTYNGVNYLPESWKDETVRNLLVAGKIVLDFQNNSFQSADFFLDNLTGLTTLHPLKMENFKGRAHFENDYLLLEDFGGKMGISSFAVNMGYNLKENSNPKKDYFHLRAQALDLDALMGFQGFEEDTNHQEAFNIFQLPFRNMEFKADIEQLNYHTFWLKDVKASLRSQVDHFLYLDTLSLRLAEGSLAVNGYFNGSDPEQIYFFSEMKADKLDLDKLLFKFENFGQDYLINENLHGLVSGTIKSKFLVYPDLTPIVDKSEATMDLTVYQGSLVNFTPLSALSSYFGDRNLNRVRFDTLANTFELKGGILHIPRMNINSSIGFIELSGRQSLDLNMDYFIRVPLAMVTQVGFRSLFGGKNRNEIDPDQEDAIVFRDANKRTRFVNINMTGTPDDYKVALRRDQSPQ